MSFAQQAHAYAKKHDISPRHAFKEFKKSGKYIPQSPGRKSPGRKSPGRQPSRHFGTRCVGKAQSDCPIPPCSWIDAKDNRKAYCRGNIKYATVSPRRVSSSSPRRVSSSSPRSACAGKQYKKCKSPCKWLKRTDKRKGHCKSSPGFSPRSSPRTRSACAGKQYKTCKSPCKWLKRTEKRKGHCKSSPRR